jgi:hypothetical protein
MSDGSPVAQDTRTITGPVTFIGDVHGWSDRLERVLDQVDGFPVLLGDLIDRGPDARGVIDRVHQLVNAGQAACVIGNHEFALVRGLGVPELGIEPYPELFSAWLRGYGGRAVCHNFGVDSGNPERLRQALGDRLAFLGSLPWILEGEMDGRHWLAVHAGLGLGPWQPQVEELRHPGAWWSFGPPEHPPMLYSKLRARQIPEDLPNHFCIVSGHTPIPKALVTRQRILCDTSGGLPQRHLSGVHWPSGRVVMG